MLVSKKRRYLRHGLGTGFIWVSQDFDLIDLQEVIKQVHIQESISCLWVGRGLDAV